MSDVLKIICNKPKSKQKLQAAIDALEEAVSSDSGDASSNDEGPNQDQHGENIPEQPEGNDIVESSQEEE